MRANGNQFEDKCIFVKYVKSFDLLCFIFHPANFAFSSNILFANPSLTQIPHQLPVYSHSIVWIQDILKFHLFFIVQPLENLCFTSTDHWIFFFLLLFHILYGYSKEGNILLTHIYLMCYRLFQQPCPRSYWPVYWWCFISMYACEHKLLFSQRKKQ